LRQLPPHVERGSRPVIRRFIRALLTFMQVLLRVLLGGHGRRPPPSDQDAPSSSDSYLHILDSHPGTRMTTVRILDPASADRGILSRHEKIESEDEVTGSLIQIDAYHAALCPTCGRLLDKETPPVAVCRLCQKVICAGCHNRCCVCQCAVCPQHSRTYQTTADKAHVYCSRCAWRHYWRLWWGLYR